MKRTVAIVFVAMLAVGVAQAADFTTNPNVANPPSGAPYVPDAPNITQSTDPSTVAAGSIACGSGGISSDNHFLRRFFLNGDHGITVQYNVTSVDMGIESVNVYVGTTAPITINTYSIANGAAFTFANMTTLDSSTRNFADGTSLVMENWVVGGSVVDPMGTDLVVSMFYADTVDAYGIWPGSNANGQSNPSFLASVGCGIPEPTDIATIGPFGDMHLVMTVNGDEQIVPTPTPPPPSGAAVPVPSLNNYGILAMVLLLVGVGILVMWRRS